MQKSAFCPVHGLFEIGSIPQNPKACPICGREGDAIHILLTPALKVLIDPKLSLMSLMAIRQIADSMSEGWITPERADTLVRGISADLGGLFLSADNGEVALALARLIGTILGNRSRNTVPT